MVIGVAAVQMVLITMGDVVLNPLWVWIVHGEVPARSVFWCGALFLLAIGLTALSCLKASRGRP